MNKILKIILFANLLILLISAIGCSEDSSIINSNPNQGGTVQTTVMGIVVDENNQPISGAVVTSHGRSTTSNPSGEFVFRDIMVPEKRLYVRAEKNGFYSAGKGEAPSNGITYVKITMLQKNVTQTISSVSGGTINLPNGSNVVIQPGSVVTAGGAPYSGNVNMYVKYMDPTDVKFSETVAGGDMMARRSDSSDAVLYSYGILKVELESQGGESLNITSDKPSTITTTIPSQLVSSAPSEIPLWYFDETTGIWREEGKATKQGDKYIGSVKHFTDWNNDYPGYLTRVTGKVVDCQGEPMPGLVVKVGQTTALTDSEGKYSRTVPTGIDFAISVEASQNFGISGSPIHVPALTQNQVYQVPLCQLACFPVVTGTFKDCSGNSIYGLLSISWDNHLQGIMPTQAGPFRIYTMADKLAHLKFTSYNGDVIDTIVQTPSSATILNIGELRSCTGQQECVNSFVITGMGYNNHLVVMSNVLSQGLYSVPDSLSAIVSASTDSTTFTLSFPGNNIGMFEGMPGTIRYHGVQYFSNSANIRVLVYENAGGFIKGTFEGEYISTLSGGSVMVRSGKFCAVRQPDILK